MDKTTAIAFSKTRASMYRFLGGLYVMEVDEDQLKKLKAMTFPAIEGDSDSDMDLREGYELMKNFIAQMDPEDIDDLAADFAKVFFAAGDATGLAAFPYEAVYTNKKRQVGGSTQMQMQALYWDRGWEPDPNAYRTMEDNIGLMLEYMGIICDEVTAALEADDMDRVKEILVEQRKFLKKHITNWVFSFTSDVAKFAQRDFYVGLAKITNGFIKKEEELLKKGVAAWVIE